MERYRFIVWDGGSFEHVGESVYVIPLAAQAHATQIARELSEDDTWRGGWISVGDSCGNEIARVPIGTGKPLTKSEAVRRKSQQAVQKSKILIRRLGEAARSIYIEPIC